MRILQSPPAPRPSELQPPSSPNGRSHAAAAATPLMSTIHHGGCTCLTRRFVTASQRPHISDEGGWPDGDPQRIVELHPCSGRRCADPLDVEVCLTPPVRRAGPRRRVSTDAFVAP